MNEITITTQKEFNELPDEFIEFTRIYIKGIVMVSKARKNSSVVARGNSSVVAWENSSVVAWENSSVEAWGNSFVVARENSSVVAWENSSVVARENSSVVARENSSVVAWENSSVVAWENSSVEFFSDDAKGTAKHNAIFIVTGCDPKIKNQDDAQVVRRKGEWLHDIKSFCDCYKSQIKGKFITLYKSVNPKTKKDFYTGTILYDGIVSCPDFDHNTDRQCGGGLHLSPTPTLALSYNKGLLLECRVSIEDIVIYPHDITKVRCRKVKVMGEYKKGGI